MKYFDSMPFGDLKGHLLEPRYIELSFSFHKNSGSYTEIPKNTRTNMLHSGVQNINQMTLRAAFSPEL